MKLFDNKKSQFGGEGFGLAKAFVYLLVSFFAVGVLFVTFHYVFASALMPVLEAQVQASTIDAVDKTTVINNMSFVYDIFRSVPIVLFIVGIIWLILVASRRETENY